MDALAHPLKDILGGPHQNKKPSALQGRERRWAEPSHRPPCPHA
jgi:hypothetical protein